MADRSSKSSPSASATKVSVSSPAPPPGPGNNRNNNSNRRNWEYKNEKYLEKQLKRQGTDPHAIKREYLGNNASIAKYDLWVDKSSGQIAIVEKMTGRIVEITHYFIGR